MENQSSPYKSQQVKYDMQWLLATYPLIACFILNGLQFENMSFLELFFGINALLILIDVWVLKRQGVICRNILYILFGFLFPFVYLFKRDRLLKQNSLSPWLSVFSILLAAFLSVRIEFPTAADNTVIISEQEAALLQDQQFLQEKIVEAIEGMELDTGFTLQKALIEMADGDLSRVRWTVEGPFYIALIEKPESTGALVFERNMEENGIFLVEVLLNGDLCATTDLVDQLECFVAIQKAP
jgi:hypothetical protein